MKQIGKYLALITFSASMVFADVWNASVTTQTTSSTYSTIDNCANKDGIHVVRIENGSPNILKYQLLNASGSLVRTTTIDNNIGNSLAIVADNNNILYAVYTKGTQIVVKKSSDVGQNWTIPNQNTKDFESGHTTSYGTDAVVDGEGKIHIAYSTSSSSSSNAEVYYYNYNPNSGEWANFKNVTDHAGFINGKDPSLAISSGRIHIAATYPGQSNIKSRDRVLSNDSWTDPITVNSQYSAAMFSSLIIDDANIYALYVHVDINLNTRLHFTKKSITGSSWDDATNLTPTDLISPSYPPQLIKTGDGKLYAFYIGLYSYLKCKRFNGTSWETETVLSSGGINNSSVSSVSNDIFVNWMQFSGGLFELKYRQYDAAPTIPTNMSINTSGGINVNWSANPEPDMQHYQVWRKINSGSFSNIATTTSTTFTDPDYSTGGNTSLTSKVKAKDLSNNLSDYSSSVSINNAAPYRNAVSFIRMPDTYKADQNYPNPFNPMTTIRYEMPVEAQVSIVVYDVIGKEIATLENGIKSAGYHETQFDASHLKSGVYFYRIKAGNYSETRRMMLIK